MVASKARKNAMEVEEAEWQRMAKILALPLRTPRRRLDPRRPNRIRCGG